MRQRASAKDAGVAGDDLSIELHTQRWRAGDLGFLGLDDLKLRTAEHFASGVERGGNYRGEQLHRAHGLNNDDVDHAVVHAAVGEQVDVVLDDRGIACHAADAVELLDNAVVLNGKVRHRGVGRGERAIFSCRFSSFK